MSGISNGYFVTYWQLDEVSLSERGRGPRVVAASLQPAASQVPKV